MPLDATSQANAVGAAVKNTQFLAQATNLARKILAIVTYDPAKTTVVDEVPVLVQSAEDAGDKFGFGSMAYRMAAEIFKGAQGVPVYIQPQSEAGGATAAAGDIDYTGAVGVLAGTVYLYIAGSLVQVPVADADTAADIATATVAAINADNTLPVTALINVTPEILDLTSKSKGPWGNEISISFNRGFGQEFPTGVVAPAVTDMVGGATNPDIQDALDGLGIDDDANLDFYTDMVHGYGQDSTVLDAIANYVGQGNEFNGLYDKLVSRPFRVLTGDVATGSAGLTALIALSDARLLDRANGVIAVPGSKSHPSEIAAQAMGHMARINNNIAAQSYTDILLIGIDPGDLADRWTSSYSSGRDLAVKSGISPTRVRAGNVVMQNVVTFYRPASVPVNNNGYRSQRNISLIQNKLNSVRVTFEQEKWQGISIVANLADVGNATDRSKVRDITSMRDEWVAIITSWGSKAWTYDPAFSKKSLGDTGAITIREANNGFDVNVKDILPPEGGILNNTVLFDISVAAAAT